MTTTPCGSPVYSYSNTWDLAISTILEEPTIYVGPRTISSHSWFLVKSNRNSVPNSTTLIDAPQGIRKGGLTNESPTQPISVAIKSYSYLESTTRRHKTGGDKLYRFKGCRVNDTH